MITHFNKTNAKETRDIAVAALKAAAADLGLDVETGNGRFTNGEFSFKVTFKTESSGHQVFAEYAETFGLVASDFGAMINTHGKKLVIDGIAPRNTRMPILLTELGTGRQFKMDAPQVLRALGR